MKKICPPKVDLVKPLKTLISSTYSTADQPADHSDAISEMQRLRVAATKATDRSLTTRISTLFLEPYCMGIESGSFYLWKC